MNFNWKEVNFKKYRLWFNAGTVALGLALAFGGIPFYGAQLTNCYVLQPPIAKVSYFGRRFVDPPPVLTFDQNYIPISMFYTLPIFSALAVMTASTFAICRRVYRQEKKAMKWKASNNMKLSRKVFWQSFWYLISFMVTLPFLIITNYLVDFMHQNVYWIFVATGIIAPAQGFLNAFVYFKRDTKFLSCVNIFSKCCQCCQCCQRCRSARHCRPGLAVP